MARFAVNYGFHAGLAPSHYLGGAERGWFAIDCASCEALRIALDREGGEDISIDYPLIVDNAQIKDQAFVAEVVKALRSLPIDYLWLRIAGFGSDATGAGIDKIVRATHSLHSLGIPIIVDQVGGLAGLALGSFGVASGFVNGLKGKDRFDARGWLVPRTSGGGNAKKVFLTGLDRRVTVAEIKALFSSSTTSRIIFGCRDDSCCGGVEAMLKEPEAHSAVQQGRALTDLSSTPESLRPDHFLRDYVGVAKRSAGRALKLRSASDEFQKLSEKASFRLDRMKESLEMTSERLGIIDFASEASLRSLQGKSQSKKGGNL